MTLYLLLACVLLGALLWLTEPLYRSARQSNKADDAQIQTYLEEIDRLDGPEEAIKKTALERQLLRLTQGKGTVDSGPSKIWLGLIFLGFLISAPLIYKAIGAPNYERIMATPPAAQAPAASPDSLETLSRKLETLLERSPSDPKGWQLYARTLMSLGRLEDALAAYDKALELAPDNPELAQEIQNAKAFAAENSERP